MISDNSDSGARSEITPERILSLGKARNDDPALAVSRLSGHAADHVNVDVGSCMRPNANQCAAMLTSDVCPARTHATQLLSAISRTAIGPIAIVRAGAPTGGYAGQNAADMMSKARPFPCQISPNSMVSSFTKTASERPSTGAKTLRT